MLSFSGMTTSPCTTVGPQGAGKNSYFLYHSSILYSFFVCECVSHAGHAKAKASQLLEKEKNLHPHLFLFISFFQVNRKHEATQ